MGAKRWRGVGMVWAVLMVTAATAGWGLGAGGSPAGAATSDGASAHRTVKPSDDSCDVSVPPLQLVNLYSTPTTSQEQCGVWYVENNAETMYAEIHGYSVDDPRLAEMGEPEIAGYIESMMDDIANVEASDPGSLNTDEQGAYDWLETIDQSFEELQAQDALNEYNKWADEQCNYRPPNTSLFSYNPMDQTYCLPQGGNSFSGLFAGLTPPSYSEFESYGTYDADQTLDQSSAISGSPDQTLIQQGIELGVGTANTILAGAAPQLFSQVISGTSTAARSLANFAKFFEPHNEAVYQTFSRGAEVQNGIEQSAKQEQETEELENEGEPPDEDLVDLEDGEGVDLSDLVDTGIDYSEAAEAGADAMSAEFVVAGIALTIAVMEATQVITDAMIPAQLQQDLTNAQNATVGQEVKNLITDPTGSGYVVNAQNFEANLSLSAFNLPEVYDNPPPPAPGTAAQLQVTALYPNGQPSSWSWTAPTVSNIDTWPLGVDDGYKGPPEETIAVQGGMAWTEQGAGSAATDETEAGLSGYLPSGELNYFNAAGKPEIAYINGNQFETITSPGSIDAGGEDEGDNCATADECTASSSIVVMGLGGTAQLQDHISGMQFLGMTCNANDPGTDDCLSDTLLPDGDLVPMGGSTTLTQNGSITQAGTGQLFRITIVPDTGTSPGTLILNQYGNYANDRLDGLPDGGLVAGQTVSLSDPETNPLGYSTTYTWQIETKCPYDPVNKPQTIDGVPVCSNSPDYNAVSLPADEQDLSSCGTTCDDLPPTWTEDPDFHGDPVTTLIGQNVSWTFPAPGTYHIRLITTDQYGFTQQSDQNAVVSAPTSPGESSLTYSAASGPAPAPVGPAVIGGVTDGDAITLTGCVSSPDYQDSTAYSVPNVTVDWGDGSTPDTGQPGNNSDPNLTFTYQPGGGCSSPWAYSVTHTYNVDTDDMPSIQEHISITIGDVTDPVTPTSLLAPGTSATSTFNVWANVAPTSLAASFESGATASTTFTAGSFGYYTGWATGVPTATVTEAPASGVTQDGVACTAGLPSGLGFDGFDNGSFTISGASNVDATGCYALTLTASDGDGAPATEVFTLDEDQAPSITSASSTAMATGSAGSFTFTSTAFPTASLKVESVSCTPSCSNALPSDLTFTDNGDGTATLSSGGQSLASADTGTYTVTVEASNAAGSTTQTFTLTIGGAPVFTSSTTAGFFTESGGGFTVTTAGYPTASLSCTAGCNPDSGIDANYSLGYEGLYFGDNGNGTATLGGEPWQSGRYTLTIEASNAVGTTTQTLTVFVSNTGGPEITFVDSGSVTQYSPPVGDTPATAQAAFEVGQPGSVTICSNNPTDILVAPNLPAGLSLTNGAGSGCPTGDATATVSGTPTTPLTSDSTGSYPVEVVDHGGGIAGLPISLYGSPTITSPSTATFTEGQAGSFTITNGTLTPDSLFGCISLSGTLPDGLTFTDNNNSSNPDAARNTGTISGTPAGSGTSQVTVEASDCNGNTTTETLNLVVNDPPSFTNDAVTGFRVGQGGSFTVTTNSDAYPIPALSAGSLPTGVTFVDNGDGTGTLMVAPDAPATTSAATVDLTATSSAGTATQSLSLAIGTPATFTAPAAPSTNATVTVGTPVSYSFETSGSPTPALTCTVSSAPCGSANLPAGMTFVDNDDGTATLSGTPTSPAAVTLEVTAANGVATSTTSFTFDADTTPSFLGTETAGGCASPSASALTGSFIAGTNSSWTLCASGSPAPAMTLAAVTCNGSPISLPAGLTFTDNGDGSATISGSAANGSGAACPSGYSLQVSMANGAGTVTQTLSLTVQDVIIATSAPDSPTFVAGVSNSYSLTASGVPSPAFAVDPSTPLPAWLTLIDHGDGTATLSGQPPLADAGSTVSLLVDETNGVASPVSEPVTITISSLALTSAAPPTAQLGEPYSYTFAAASPVTFALSVGEHLPAGMSLSASGVLSGTPTETGRFPLNVQLTQGATTVTTSSINFVVGVGSHALEISQFRSFGPSGVGDWFVQVDNTTEAAISLQGWSVGVQTPGSTTPTLLNLGDGKLAPGQTALVAGPSFSLSSVLHPSTTGPGVLALPGGFEVVAPDGVVTDVAGEAGAAAGLFAGTGAAFPKKIHVSEQDAFVRNGFAAGSPVDTGDNASDFRYETARLPQVITFMSSPPKRALVGGTYTVAATGGDSGNPVNFALGTHTTPGACTLSGSVITFSGVGRCVIAATQAGKGAYLPAPTAKQGITVVKSGQTITFTSTPPSPAQVGDVYTVTATGGASGNPVLFALGANTTPGACTISGSQVTLSGPGHCLIDANQGGDADFRAAPTAVQKLTVEKQPQTIVFTSTPPSPPMINESYTVTATGGASGNPVTFSLSPSSNPNACALVDGSLVLFTGPGECRIQARQAGNAAYLPAPTEVQKFRVHLVGP